MEGKVYGKGDFYLEKGLEVIRYGPENIKENYWAKNKGEMHSDTSPFLALVGAEGFEPPTLCL